MGVDDAGEDDGLLGGGVAFLFRGEFGWFGSCLTARLTKAAAP